MKKNWRRAAGIIGAGVFLAQPAGAQSQAIARGLTTLERAKQAIGQRYLDIAGEKLDLHGYVSRPELNLIADVRLEDVQDDLSHGSGQELAGKFRAAHSSSALAVNNFGCWKKAPENLSLLGVTGFDRLQFERKCPTGLGGIPPNLDVLIEGKGMVVGIESKFLEILSAKQPKFADSYTRENLPQMEDCWWELLCAAKTGPKRYLDTAQLVRHYLGLRNQAAFKGKKIVLLYIFWEPENRNEFVEYRRHREELSAVQDQVSESTVTFSWMSYPELWNQWETQILYSVHVSEIKKRYLLSI